MPSFRITISPKRLAAAQYVTTVRRELQRALAAEAASGLTQAEVARRLEVNRSVVNRQLKGETDITQGGAAELAWAMGYRPVFRLEKEASLPREANARQEALAPPPPPSGNQLFSTTPLGAVTEAVGSSDVARGRVVERYAV